MQIKSNLIIMVLLLSITSFSFAEDVMPNLQSSDGTTQQIILPSDSQIVTDAWISKCRLFSGNKGKQLYTIICKRIADAIDLYEESDVILFQAASLSSGKTEVVDVGIELEKGLTFKYYIALIQTIENRWKIKGNDAIVYIKGMLGISMTQAKAFYELPKKI